MSFRKTGHANSKTAMVRMRARFVELANEFDQIDRMFERALRLVVSNFSRPIAAERENVSNPRLGVSKQNRFDLLFVMTDAGEVRNRVQLCCTLNAFDKIVS